MSATRQYQIFALERCILQCQSFARAIEAANPDDPYAALMILEDIKLLAALRAALSAADAVRDGSTMVPALEVFRIAGGDVECQPEPTADAALECLRDLRKCYDEALSGSASGVVDAIKVLENYKAQFASNVRPDDEDDAAEWDRIDAAIAALRQQEG